MPKVFLKNARKKKSKVIVDKERPIAESFFKAAGDIAGNTSGKDEERFINFCHECIANDPGFLLPYREIAERRISRGDYAGALNTFSAGAREGIALVFENEDEYEDGSVYVPYREKVNKHIFHFFNAYAKALWVIGRREDARELLEFIASLDDSDPLLVVPDVLALTMGFGAGWKDDFIAGGRREHASRNMRLWLSRHAPLYPDVFIVEEYAPELTGVRQPGDSGEAMPVASEDHHHEEHRAHYEQHIP